MVALRLHAYGCMFHVCVLVKEFVCILFFHLMANDGDEDDAYKSEKYLHCQKMHHTHRLHFGYPHVAFCM